MSDKYDRVAREITTQILSATRPATEWTARDFEEALGRCVSFAVDVLRREFGEVETADRSEITNRWNALAKAHGLRAVKRLSANRWQKYLRRLKESPTFWDVLKREIPRLSSFAREKPWFGFDWLIHSQDNFDKFDEGKYRDDAPSPATGPERSLTGRRARVIAKTSDFKVGDEGTITGEFGESVFFKSNGKTADIPLSFVDLID